MSDLAAASLLRVLPVGGGSGLADTPGLLKARMMSSLFPPGPPVPDGQQVGKPTPEATARQALFQNAKLHEQRLGLHTFSLDSARLSLLLQFVGGVILRPALLGLPCVDQLLFLPLQLLLQLLCRHPQPVWVDQK